MKNSFVDIMQSMKYQYHVQFTGLIEIRDWIKRDCLLALRLILRGNRVISCVDNDDYIRSPSYQSPFLGTLPADERRWYNVGRPTVFEACTAVTQHWMLPQCYLNAKSVIGKTSCVDHLLMESPYLLNPLTAKLFNLHPPPPLEVVSR